MGRLTYLRSVDLTKVIKRQRLKRVQQGQSGDEKLFEVTTGIVAAVESLEQFVSVNRLQRFHDRFVPLGINFNRKHSLYHFVVIVECRVWKEDQLAMIEPKICW